MQSRRRVLLTVILLLAIYSVGWGLPAANTHPAHGGYANSPTIHGAGTGGIDCSATADQAGGQHAGVIHCPGLEVATLVDEPDSIFARPGERPAIDQPLHTAKRHREVSKRPPRQS
ncbi:MAG: hypothetical protein ACTSX7_15300 [Alphaproteobacteria bacterium]